MDVLVESYIISSALNWMCGKRPVAVGGFAGVSALVVPRVRRCWFPWLRITNLAPPLSSRGGQVVLLFCRRATLCSSSQCSAHSAFLFLALLWELTTGTAAFAFPLAVFAAVPTGAPHKHRSSEAAAEGNGGVT